MNSTDQQGSPHNLSLYQLEGFTGSRRKLLVLHEWLTGGDDLPAIAISGEQGNGKSTLATAVAWNHFYHFSDGIIRVSPAGVNPFRLYDVVRTMDTVLGTALTRTSADHWGLSILEQLYKRRRLLILDKLAGATPEEINTLVGIIGHLHENEGQSRILLIDRNFNPAIAQLVQHQHLPLSGLEREDILEFIQRRAPASIRAPAMTHAEDLFAWTQGAPLCMRFLLGLLLDMSWADLVGSMEGLAPVAGDNVGVKSLCAFAVENYAVQNPSAGVLLNRMIHAVGGVPFPALRNLFWGDLGSDQQLQATVDGLATRGLLELDPFRQRAVIHPVVRRYLEENAALLGEEWRRRHAAFYLGQARQYQMLPLERWPEVDMDWGNIFRGADWCAQRIEGVWACPALEMLTDPRHDLETVAQHPEVPALRADLRLARDYAVALADYAFWRHPPGIVRWLAVGAVAALALNDLRSHAWCLMNIGRQLFFLGRLQEAIQWFDRARPIFDQRDLLAELANVYTDLGTTYRVMDEPRQAVEYFRIAFDCAAQLGEQHALATAYMNLGSAYFSLHEHERALAEHRKALRIALRSHDRALTASVYNNMGLASEAIEQYDDAVHAYEHALRIFQEIDDVTGISACYNNLGSACYARSDLAHAQAWYEKDMALLQQRGAWTDLAATLHNLGHVALEQGNHERARRYFQESRDLYAAFDLQEYVEEEEEMLKHVRS